MKKINAEFSMFLTIHDAELLSAAATVRAIEEGVSPDEASRTYTVENLGSCLVMLLDPSTLPGCEILDSVGTVPA